MLPKHSQKPFWQIFQQTFFTVVSEKIFVLHHFLTPKNYILETLWKQMSVSIYLLKKNCFRDVVRFVLVVEGERWDGGRLNKFLKAVHCSGLAKCFTIFILIGIFENLTIFSISIHLFIALKRWNFPDNLDFKSKTEATFLIRSHFISI